MGVGIRNPTLPQRKCRTLLQTWETQVYPTQSPFVRKGKGASNASQKGSETRKEFIFLNKSQEQRLITKGARSAWISQGWSRHETNCSPKNFGQANKFGWWNRQFGSIIITTKAWGFSGFSGPIWIVIQRRQELVSWQNAKSKHYPARVRWLLAKVKGIYFNKVFVLQVKTKCRKNYCRQNTVLLQEARYFFKSKFGGIYFRQKQTQLSVQRRLAVSINLIQAMKQLLP